MPEIKLKNCPFCDSEDVKIYDVAFGEGFECFHVACMSCRMQGAIASGSLGAIRFWNMLPRKSEEK